MKKSTKVAPEGMKQAEDAGTAATTRPPTEPAVFTDARPAKAKSGSFKKRLSNGVQNVAAGVSGAAATIARNSSTHILHAASGHDEKTETEAIMGASGMFHEAAEHGDLTQVENYMKLAKDKDGNVSKLVMLSKDIEDHRNALHKSCLNGHTEIVTQLLTNDTVKEGIDIRDRYGCTALYLACVEARHTLSSGERVSHEQTQLDKCMIVESLLLAGADLAKAWTHNVGAKGSCFHWCAAHGFPVLLHLLMTENEKHAGVTRTGIRSLLVQKDARARIPIDIAGSIYLKLRFEYEENLPKVNDVLKRIGLEVEATVSDDVVQEGEREDSDSSAGKSMFSHAEEKSIDGAARKKKYKSSRRTGSFIRRSGTIKEAHDGSIAVVYSSDRGDLTNLNVVEQQLMNREQTLVKIVSSTDLKLEADLASTGKANRHLLQSVLSWCSFIGLESKVQNVIEIARKEQNVGVSLSWAKIHGQNGRTALHFAAIMGRNSIIETLLNFNGNYDLDQSSRANAPPPSSCCCCANATSSLSSAINQPDYFGNTPLHLCAMQTNYPVYFGATGDTARILLRRGADARTLNALGRSPANYVRGVCENEFRVATQKQTFFDAKESCFDDKAVRDPTDLSFDWVIRFKKNKNPRCGPWVRTLWGDDCCSCFCKASQKGDTLIKQAAKHRKHLEVFLKKKWLLVTSYDTEEHALLLITGTEKTLLRHAETLKIELPVLRQRLQEVYQPTRHFVFEPLRSRERVRIIKAVVDKHMNLDVYQKSGIVVDFFPMHEDTELEVVNRRWTRGCCPEPFNSPWDLLDEHRSSLMAGLTTLGAYFGEEIAMYFSFLSFYTLFLGYFLVIPGALVAGYQLYNIWAGGLKSDTLNSPFVPIFAAYLAVWCTILVEKWKRKQAELAYRWDTADFVREEQPLAAYWGPERFHPIKREVEKHFPESRRRKRQCIGMIPMMIMIGLVVAVFQGIVHFRRLFAARQAYPMDVVWGAIAGIGQGATIAALNYLYKWVAVAVTNYENYKTQTQYDNAMIIKLFSFQFVNGNLALIQAAFVDRDPIRLWTLLILLMTGQQLLDTVKRNVIPRLMFIWRWKALKMFVRNFPLSERLHSLQAEFSRIRASEQETEDAAKKEEELATGKTHLSVTDKKHSVSEVAGAREQTREKKRRSEPEAIEEALRNCAMEDQADMMIDNYAVIVSQYTYVVLWSVAFPLAPLFAFLVNFLQIRGEVGLYCLSTKRAMPNKEFGIGSWCIIIEIVSLIGVVSNTVMIISTFSSRAVFLQYVDESWDLFLENEYVFMAFIIFLEHGIIALKLSLASIIADKPAWVLEEELIELEETRRETEHERDLQLSAKKQATGSPSAVKWFQALTSKVTNDKVNREANRIQAESAKQRKHAIEVQERRKAVMNSRVKHRLQARREAKSSGALKKSSIFAGLSEAATGKLIDIMEYETFDGDMVVCREGAAANKMYLIISGECEVLDGGLTLEDTSDDVVFFILGENDVFGESALFPGKNGEIVPRRKKTVRVKKGSMLRALTMESVDFHRVVNDGTLSRETVTLLEQVAKERQQQNQKRERGEVKS